MSEGKGIGMLGRWLVMMVFDEWGGVNPPLSLSPKELINEFGKTQEEAKEILKKSKVEESLARDKFGFHESSYNWTISILTDQNDYEALEKYIYH